MNLVIHVFDTVKDGPLWKRADEAYNQHPKNFGLIGTWQGEAGAQTLAAQVGVSFPGIAFGVFCPQGIKYFAKLPGMSTVQEIYNSIDLAFAQPEPNCNQTNGPVPVLSPSYGGNGETPGGGNGSDDCAFDGLPILGDTFAFLCGIDKWLWLGLAAYSTLKTTDSVKREAQVAWGAVAAFSAVKAAQRFKLLIPWWAYGAVAGYTAFKTKESLPKRKASLKDANTVTYTYGLGTAYLLFRAYKSFQADSSGITGLAAARPMMRLRMPAKATR